MDCLRFNSQEMTEAAAAFYENLDAIIYDELTKDKVDVIKDAEMDQHIDVVSLDSRPSVIVENTLKSGL